MARKTGGIYFEMHQMLCFHHKVFLQHDPLYHKQRGDITDSPFSTHAGTVYNHEGEFPDLDSAPPMGVDKSLRMHTEHVLLFHTMSVNFHCYIWKYTSFPQRCSTIVLHYSRQTYNYALYAFVGMRVLRKHLTYQKLGFRTSLLRVGFSFRNCVDFGFNFPFLFVFTNKKKHMDYVVNLCRKLVS